MSEKSKAKEEQADVFCPLCFLIKAAEEKKKQHAPFFNHLKAAEKEFLLGLKSLIDERIDVLGEKPPPKATKIKVE